MTWLPRTVLVLCIATGVVHAYQAADGIISPDSQLSLDSLDGVMHMIGDTGCRELPIDTDMFMGPHHVDCHDTEANVELTLTTPIRITHMAAVRTSAGTGENETWLRKNGVDASAVCTNPSRYVSCDLSLNVSYAAGDTLSIRTVVSSGTPGDTEGTRRFVTLTYEVTT
jgi:hypothetical protein